MVIQYHHHRHSHHDHALDGQWQLARTSRTLMEVCSLRSDGVLFAGTWGGAFCYCLLAAAFWCFVVLFAAAFWYFLSQTSYEKAVRNSPLALVINNYYWNWCSLHMSNGCNSTFSSSQIGNVHMSMHLAIFTQTLMDDARSHNPSFSWEKHSRALKLHPTVLVEPPRELLLLMFNICTKVKYQTKVWLQRLKQPFGAISALNWE